MIHFNNEIFCNKESIMYLSTGQTPCEPGDDQYNVNTIYNRFKEAKKAYPSQYPKFYIYHTETQTRIGYDPDKPITSVIKIRTALDLIK